MAIISRQFEELDSSILTSEEVALLNFSHSDAPVKRPEWPSYNVEKCKSVTASWGNSTLHISDPTSMMSLVFQGRTCEPPSISPASNQTCTSGGYPAYAINASRIADIQLGVNFARRSGIRLVIKNTGHDFSGKSGGAGALSIWTHHLKGMEFVPEFRGEGKKGYNGPAFKCRSGIQAWEIYEAASKQGLVVVGGEGRTVGVMGGYILGGGHSPLSSIHGLGADHIISLDIVLSSGRFITATPTKNYDIYWALAGGGGSTLGVVTSVTVKAHPDFPVTAFSFSFSASSTAVLWAGVPSFFNYFIPLSEAGTYSYFNVFPGVIPTFSMKPFFAPNLTIVQTEALLKPWFDDLAALGIFIVAKLAAYPNYLRAWQANFPQEGAGGDTSIVGSRLFPRSNWLNETLLNATFTAWKESVDADLFTISFNFGPTLAAGGDPDNSVNPAWRESVMHAMQLVLWPSDANYTEIKQKRDLLTERQNAWIEVSPGAGAFLGESDREDVDFQQNFYGKNYARSLRIKHEIDPEDVFWAKTAVGSDAWHIVNYGPVDDENGRLCRV
ncbi:related to isoamyl alcohol oxidase [Rhynchosporium graminicola]|uniref:Related to isoamyl alcohol oxidase n=1 Tax=Rhynchosporium graminicola TaxID=2792576 RepID=A0A1E1KVK1_9HELO|nr:related to isoamyl alcohol oxidase [Rhynchosporium commune]